MCRRAIGVISIALPFVLVVGTWLLGGSGIESSISAYYYTPMRDVFVGTLCATGAFLLAYRGYDRGDRIASNLACLFAVGLSLLPTTPSSGASVPESLIGYVHLVLAAAYFLMHAYFSLVPFRRTDPGRRMTSRKRRRNKLYTVCGYTILACLGLTAVEFALPAHPAVRALDPVFWLETAAVVAFGVAWLTKGGAFLSDGAERHQR